MAGSEAFLMLAILVLIAIAVGKVAGTFVATGLADDAPFVIAALFARTPSVPIGLLLLFFISNVDIFMGVGFMTAQNILVEMGIATLLRGGQVEVLIIQSMRWRCKTSTQGQ